MSRQGALAYDFGVDRSVIARVGAARVHTKVAAGHTVDASWSYDGEGKNFEFNCTVPATPWPTSNSAFASCDCERGVMATTSAFYSACPLPAPATVKVPFRDGITVFEGGQQIWPEFQHNLREIGNVAVDSNGDSLLVPLLVHGNFHIHVANVTV